MAYGNYTQLLRLADVYLIYTEAKISNAGSTTDASAIDAFYKLCNRAVSTYDARKNKNQFQCNGRSADWVALGGH